MEQGLFANFFKIQELSAGETARAKLLWLANVRNYVVALQYFCIIPGWVLGFVNESNIYPYLVVFTSLFLLNQYSKSRLDKDIVITERELFLNLCYDQIQLAILVSMTGGWQNPFSSVLMIYIILAAVMLSEIHKIYFLFLYLGTALFINSFHFDPIQNFYPWTQKWLDVVIEIFVGFAALVVVSFLKAGIVSSKRRLEAVKNESLRQDRLRAIGALSGGVCHRIASPLNNLKLRVDRLARVDNDRVLAEIDSMEASIERIEEALRTLTSVSQDASVDAISVKSIDILELVQESNDVWLKGSACRNNTIKLTSNIKSRVLKLPQVMFVQSYLDILDNACAVSGKDSVIGVHLEEGEKTFTVSIKDSGKGFNQAIIDRLGEPFNSTNINGRGLGLYQARIMCQYLGGDIDIKSSRKGSTVSLKFSKEIVYE